jgi:SPP1 gp7 family putative phage head morphogenesis protein
MASVYDMLTRHQVYLEGVKSEQGNDFDDTVRVLSSRVRTILASAPENLGDMPAAEYRKLHARLNRQLNTTFKRSKATMLGDFEAFVPVDRGMMIDIMKASKTTLRRMPTANALWKKAMGKVMGANGITLGLTVERFYAGAKQSILERLAQARANGETKQELLESLFGSRDNPKSGLINKIRNQGRTVIATGLQHISSVIQSYLEGIFYERYRWVSVIDDKTTNICRSRDGKTYRYGKGPVPPAHYNCRSKIVPITPDQTNNPTTYFGWLENQPDAVLTDIVGSDNAKRIQNGTATSKEFPGFLSSRRLTLDRFKAKLPLILL